MLYTKYILPIFVHVRSTSQRVLFIPVAPFFYSSANCTPAFFVLLSTGYDSSTRSRQYDNYSKLIHLHDRFVSYHTYHGTFVRMFGWRQLPLRTFVREHLYCITGTVYRAS